MVATRAPLVRAGRIATGIRRHRLLLYGTVLVGLGVGIAMPHVLPTSYRATATVLVLPVPTSSDVHAPIDLDTEAQLARSTDAITRAAAILGAPVQPRLADAVSVSPLAGSSVLAVTYTASTPAAAQAGARAFAQAYLAGRGSAAADALRAQTGTLQALRTDATNQLATLDAQLARLTAGSPRAATLRDSRAAVQGRVTTLSSRLDDLVTTAVTPGRIISDSTLPAAPVRPAWWIPLALGAGLGLVVGAGLVTISEQLNRTLRDAHDIIRTGLPVLACLDPAGKPVRRPTTSPRRLRTTTSGPGWRLTTSPPGLRGTNDTRGAGSRDLTSLTETTGSRPGYDRLRNEVAATLSAADRVLLVTSANRGAPSTVVAANLAAALARVGHEVILLGANPPDLGVDTVLLSGLFDIADIPGLTDVLGGRVTLAAALQTPPREPRLRVVTPGGAASANGLLQSQTAAATIARLRGQARFIVVDSPSTASSADAQSLAGHADAAILVAETGRTRHDQLGDGAAQLRAVGVRVLGAVLLPRGGRARPPRLSSTMEDDGRGPGNSSPTARAHIPTATPPGWLGVDDADELAR
jgi:Mrp family chromosome partitioning ATPase/capsular polysaccharide biosynthesis protein